MVSSGQANCGNSRTRNANAFFSFNRKGVPNVAAWGSKARKYFGTDYVDKDGAGISERDRLAAEAEEEEGIAAQKRLIDELNESAIDFDCFQTDESAGRDKYELDDEAELDNLDSLSDKEKEEFLKRQSPEFFIFRQDYEHYLNESKSKLRKIIDLCEDAKYAAFRENDLYKFIAAKEGLIQRYLANISFLMLLKTKGTNVKAHPIRSTLNLYRKLCKQTDDYLESIGLSDLNVLIEKLKNENEFDPNNLGEVQQSQVNGELGGNEEGNKKRKNKSPTKKKKRVKFADEMKGDDLPISKAIDRRIDERTNDEVEQANEGEEEKDKEFYSDEEQDEKEVLFVHKREDVKKRRISRMIEKNKGLTPYRKRDYRNPRVRYKGKFKKAEIKRKSQVKEPVKELKKYSGEYHGIKSSVVRSVRFK